MKLRLCSYCGKRTAYVKTYRYSSKDGYVYINNKGARWAGRRCPDCRRKNHRTKRLRAKRKNTSKYKKQKLQKAENKRVNRPLHSPPSTGKLFILGANEIVFGRNLGRAAVALERKINAKLIQRQYALNRLRKLEQHPKLMKEVKQNRIKWNRDWRNRNRYKINKYARQYHWRNLYGQYAEAAELLNKLDKEVRSYEK